MQVGCQHGPGGKSDPGLSDEESRSHFGSWAIVSSPLTLSHDVNDDTISDKIWPIISNTEALEVSQAYFGFSGGPFKQATEKVLLTDSFIESNEAEEAVSAPSNQFLYKPMSWEGKKTAVLAMNSDSSTKSLGFSFKDVPGLTCTTCNVRDIWAHKDLGSFTGQWSGSVAGHDAAFLVVTAA